MVWLIRCERDDIYKVGVKVKCEIVNKSLKKVLAVNSMHANKFLNDDKIMCAVHCLTYAATLSEISAN